MSMENGDITHGMQDIPANTFKNNILMTYTTVVILSMCVFKYISAQICYLKVRKREMWKISVSHVLYLAALDIQNAMNFKNIMWRSMRTSVSSFT